MGTTMTRFKSDDIYVVLLIGLIVPHRGLSMSNGFSPSTANVVFAVCAGVEKRYLPGTLL